MEVIEVLESGNEALAFQDFSDFLATLNSSESIEIADRTPLKQFSQRAAYIAEKSDTAEGPRLFDSLQAPVTEQIVDTLGSRPVFSELLCLSPFHHPRADPIN